MPRPPRKTRRPSVWLVVPLVLLAVAGGRVCRCACAPDTDHAEHRLTASADRHHETAGGRDHEHDGHSHEPGEPAHDHGSQDTGCECVGVALCAAELARDALDGNPASGRILAADESFSGSGTKGLRMSAMEAVSCRAHPPPAFRLLCSYRC